MNRQECFQINKNDDWQQNIDTSQYLEQLAVSPKEDTGRLRGLGLIKSRWPRPSIWGLFRPWIQGLLLPIMQELGRLLEERTDEVHLKFLDPVFPGWGEFGALKLWGFCILKNLKGPGFHGHTTKASSSRWGE